VAVFVMFRVVSLH